MPLENILNDLKLQQEQRRKRITSQQIQSQLPQIQQFTSQNKNIAPINQSNQINTINPIAKTNTAQDNINKLLNRDKVQPLNANTNLNNQLQSLQDTRNKLQSLQGGNMPGSTITTGQIQDSGKGSNIVNQGLKYQGTKYVWGGNQLNKGVDCSGLTQQLFKQNGIELPRTASEQSKVGKAVSYGEAQPGDLLFFNTLDNDKLVDHVGIYMGNGQMLHASSGKKQVMTTNVDDKYWQSRLTGVRRN